MIAVILAGWLLAADPTPASPPERMTTLVVFGNDPCPQSRADEIVVCARQPEGDRYRIPRRFRDKTPEAAQESWTNRATALEYVGRAGTPNSCSPVGSGGQTGCFSQFLQQARDERREAASDPASAP